MSMINNGPSRHQTRPGAALLAVVALAACSPKPTDSAAAPTPTTNSGPDTEPETGAETDCPPLHRFVDADGDAARRITKLAPMGSPRARESAPSPQLTVPGRGSRDPRSGRIRRATSGQA